MNQTQLKAVVFGGNGYVGTRIAERLVAKDLSVVCVSRSGEKPLHLAEELWSDHVQWLSGDAANPDVDLLRSADILVISIGSPPVPTFSISAYERQVFVNGTTCVNTINLAAKVGVKRLILIGAQLPSFMQTDRFGYAKGKRLSLEAAKRFSEFSSEHCAVVLQPGLIYGKRYLKNGKAVSLDKVFKPLRIVASSQLVSVDGVAEKAMQMAVAEIGSIGQFSIIGNADI